jgi:hypothetical protein
MTLPQSIAIGPWSYIPISLSTSAASSPVKRIERSATNWTNRSFSIDLADREYTIPDRLHDIS